MTHRLWNECESTLQSYCQTYMGCELLWTERAKTFNPIFVIGIMYDMYKCSTLPSIRSLEEAIEAELVSTRIVLPRSIEDFVSMLYSKHYIPRAWDPIDMSALSLLARRGESSPDDTCATLCRVFLRSNGDMQSKGSASKLICDALRRGAQKPVQKRARESEIEEYDPLNPSIEGFMVEARKTVSSWSSKFQQPPPPLPPPQSHYPFFMPQQQQLQSPPMMLDTNALNALYASLSGGGVRAS